VQHHIGVVHRLIESVEEASLLSEQGV